MAWNEEIKKELGSCGADVFIGHNVIFTSPELIHLGNKVRIDPFTLITTQLEVSDYVQICSHVIIGGGAQQKVTLEEWTFIGYGSKLFTASEDYSGDYGPVNEFWNHENKIFRGNITLQKFSGIASDVLLMPGVVLPEGCTVGAQSFIYTRNSLTPWSVWMGNPVRFHKSRNQLKVLEVAAHAR